MNKEELFEAMAGDLASELGAIHGTLFNLITGLTCTDLSPRQRVMVDAAYLELLKSQGKFLVRYADELDGTMSGKN